MADTKYTALSAAGALDGTEIFGVSQSAVSKKATITQVATLVLGLFIKLITGSSGAANANAAPCETWQRLSSNATANSTTSIVAVMTTTALPAGTYLYRYDIICQSAATTTSVKFSVDSTATVTRHLYELFFPSAGVTAVTGVATQAVNATTGQVYGFAATRTDNTVLGPFTDVDTLNADVHYVIEGMLTTSGSGDLVLGHASEVAASSQVMADTTLVLKRVA